MRPTDSVVLPTPLDVPAMTTTPTMPAVQVSASEAGQQTIWPSRRLICG